MRIAYGVSGEGMGHATRSAVVIEHLLERGHDLHIFTYSRAYDYLSARYPNVHLVKGFSLVYKDDELRNIESVVHNLKTMPRHLVPTFGIIMDAYKRILPQIVVSDFEIFTEIVGKIIRVPVISANNISVVEKTDVKTIKRLTQTRWLTRATSVSNTIVADYVVIPTFFYTNPKSSKVFLTPPVVRKGVCGKKTLPGDRLLVYQTSPTSQSILHTLKTMNVPCDVFGFGHREDDGSLQYHAFDDDVFATKLASSKAVITGGGFGVISEALYHKKPILSVPLRNHYEQILNARQIQELKYGEFRHDPSQEDIADFLLKLPFYQHYLNKYDFDPMEFPSLIATLVEMHAREPTIKPIE